MRERNKRSFADSRQNKKSQVKKNKIPNQPKGRGLRRSDYNSKLIISAIHEVIQTLHQVGPVPKCKLPPFSLRWGLRGHQIQYRQSTPSHLSCIPTFRAFYKEVDARLTKFSKPPPRPLLGPADSQSFHGTFNHFQKRFPYLTLTQFAPAPHCIYRRPQTPMQCCHILSLGLVPQIIQGGAT